MSTAEELWQQLLRWVAAHGGVDSSAMINLVETEAGRGLVAARDIPPSTKLISIPATLLCNSSTLAPLYPPHFVSSLSATQFVSLHLALQTFRHAQSSPPAESSPRDRFWPFIASLPTEFATLPLSWALGAKTRAELIRDFTIQYEDETIDDWAADVDKRRRCAELLKCLAPGVRVRAAAVERRFAEDWQRVKHFWSQHVHAVPAELDRLRFRPFYLAWCNVNTRCVYHDLGNKTSDNLTLAPIIDMINHQSHRATQPKGSPLALSFSAPPVGSTSEPPYRQGDELVFSYGAHDDSMLLSEYGFTLATERGDGNPYNCVNIDRHVEQLFRDQGAAGALKRGILQDEGYWGDMTLQASTSPAERSYPSFRVLVALRLLHLVKVNSAAALQPWLGVVAGDLDIVSHSNEAAVEASIRDIANVIILESEEGLDLCRRVADRWSSKAADLTTRASLGMLKGVFESDRSIAASVLSGLRA